MPEPWAEVIGDPISHSLSPMIHRHWLEALGLHARFGRTRVTADELASFLAARRADPAWRGCSVTAPHKVAIVPLLDRVTPDADRIGAVNCLYREGDALVGDNSDVAGIAEALEGTSIAGRTAVILGAGGAAAPALDHLALRGAGEIVIAARNLAKAESLRLRAPHAVAVRPFSPEAVRGASAIINATPLGMAGGMPMPEAILAALPSAMAGATVFDMVYRPELTQFLAAARDAGLRPVSGLTMLVGQARPAFERFFGRPPSEDDEALYRTLARY